MAIPTTALVGIPEDPPPNGGDDDTGVEGPFPLGNGWDPLPDLEGAERESPLVGGEGKEPKSGGEGVVEGGDSYGGKPEAVGGEVIAGGIGLEGGVVV